MIIAVCVLAWCLINLLATLAFIIADRSGIDSWEEYAELILWMILSPWVCFGIGFIIKRIKKSKKEEQTEPKIYWAKYDD
jgi:phosphate/sulfate permease